MKNQCFFKKLINIHSSLRNLFICKIKIKARI